MPSSATKTAVKVSCQTNKQSYKTMKHTVQRGRHVLQAQARGRMWSGQCHYQQCSQHEHSLPPARGEHEARDVTATTNNTEQKCGPLLSVPEATRSHAYVHVEHIQCHHMHGLCGLRGRKLSPTSRTDCAIYLLTRRTKPDASAYLSVWRPFSRLCNTVSSRVCASLGGSWLRGAVYVAMRASTATNDDVIVKHNVA